MITGISIENFKGIGDKVSLELRPITLLFGANSAGKSTILHALHYAREVFERHNLDADQTIGGGKYIDLGGFEHFIHRRDQEDVIDVQKPIRLRIDLEVTKEDLPSFDVDFNYLSGSGHTREGFDSFLNEIESAAVELTIAWSSLEDRPFVARTMIYYDNVEFAQLIANPNLRGVELRFTKPVEDPNNPESTIEAWTLDHPCLKTNADGMPEEDLFGDPIEDEAMLRHAMYECFEMPPEEQPLEVSGGGDALPDSDKPLQVDPEPFLRKTAIEDLLDFGEAKDFAPSADRQRNASELILAISELVLGPCQLVRDQLKQFRYLGPLRDTPPRNYQPPRFPDPSRWSSGLGAWDALHNGSDQLVDSVGQWLGEPENLDAGCSIERRTHLELDRTHPVVRKLIAGRAFDDIDGEEGADLARARVASRIVIVPNASEIELRPHDVGVGISQVVPVIVMALDGEGRLLAIEQPELHIHPRLQAEIADLFIEAIHDKKHRFIIETHSEHLILRLLRRIREAEKGKCGANRQLRTDDLAVYYLRQEDGSSTASRIDVDVQGEFIQPWPDDFFEIDFYERFS